MAFRHKFSVSFLLEVEDCSAVNATVLSVVKNVLMNGIVVYGGCRKNAPSAVVKEA